MISKTCKVNKILLAITTSILLTSTAKATEPVGFPNFSIHDVDGIHIGDNINTVISQVESRDDFIKGSLFYFKMNSSNYDSIDYRWKSSYKAKLNDGNISISFTSPLSGSSAYKIERDWKFSGSQSPHLSSMRKSRIEKYGQSSMYSAGAYKQASQIYLYLNREKIEFPKDVLAELNQGKRMGKLGPRGMTQESSRKGKRILECRENAPEHLSALGRVLIENEPWDLSAYSDVDRNICSASISYSVKIAGTSREKNARAASLSIDIIDHEMLAVDQNALINYGQKLKANIDNNLSNQIKIDGPKL